jgi:hypothetical protein
MTHLSYLRHSVPNVSTTHSQFYSLRVKVSLSFRTSQLTCTILRTKVTPPLSNIFQKIYLDFNEMYLGQCYILYEAEIIFPQIPFRYQHISSNFACNVVHRLLKAVC